MPLFSRWWVVPNTTNFDPERLRVSGPALQVEVSIPTQLAAALQQAQQPLPQPRVGLALIDTGASITGVDIEILQGLGLNPTGAMNVATPSATSAQLPVYACVLSFPGTPLPAVPFNRVVGSQLAGLGYAALIGRDMLRFFQMVYNGVEGIWTLAF